LLKSPPDPVGFTPEASESSRRQIGVDAPTVDQEIRPDLL
jgi:hypothetical protein